jgi:hypothetical protein
VTLYKVTGNTGFLGYAPGEEFEADLGPDVERRAKARGAIRVLKRDTKHEHEKKEDDNG